MDLIEPKKLKTLGPFSIDIIEHTEKDKAPGSRRLGPFYSFNTVADLKRDIWIANEGEAEWSPNRIWIAKENEHGLFQPLEMTWGDQTTLNKGLSDPFTTYETPDGRVVDADGNRKAIYPMLSEGILLESVLDEVRTVHVWPLEVLVRLIGAKLEDKAFLHGYIQLYFPKIQSSADALDYKDESYDLTAEYSRQRKERLNDIDALLSGAELADAEPFRLRHLRRLNGVIPLPQKTSLDIMFYEFKTSKDLPFLRYFPPKGQGEPLLKLAVGSSGFPLISDPGMLASFLDEEPISEFGAVLMAKIPFKKLAQETIPAIRNIAYTIYWLEDGSATVKLEAPRRDMPIEVATVEESEQLLKTALESLDYDEAKPVIENLSAVYRIEIKGAKLTQEKLKERVKFFSPFLELSASQVGSKLNLKWKAVDNYEQEGAVFSWLTRKVLDEDLDGDLPQIIQNFKTGIMEEFGRSEEDAKRLIEDWFRRRSEVVPTGEGAVLAHNTGVEIEITFSHPLYFVEFIGIDSAKTLQRCISIMSAFFYYNKEGPVEAVQEAPVAPKVNVVLNREAAARANPAAARFLDLFGPADDDDDEMEEEAAPAPADKAPEKKVQRNAAKTVTLPPLKEWYKTQLDLYDEALFGYSGKAVYSRVCQTAQGRVPNVMVPEQLDALVKEYGDSVEWVFLPPPENIILNVSKMKKPELIVELNKRGFAEIKSDSSKKIGDLQTLLQETLCQEPGPQGQFCRILRKDKPEKAQWFVARAGTNPEKPMYYICPEYWCVRDMRPLLPKEFLEAKARDGSSKEPNSCPFCGGKLLEDLKSPRRGETVVRRKGKHGEHDIHEVVGYITDNIHPQNFALPCCFTGPKIGQLMPLDGTQPLPKDTREKALSEAAPVQEEEEEQEKGGKAEGEDEELTKVLKTVRTQYILGFEKRQLEPGRIGLCPTKLDDMIGQVSSDSIMKGVAQKLKATAKLFARFGIAQREAGPGQAFLALLGFYMGNLQKAGKAPMRGAKIDLPSILTPAAVAQTLFSEEPGNSKFLTNLMRAFERANSGNLVQEFASNLEHPSLPDFAAKLGFNLEKDPHNRPYVERLASAWLNFKAYVLDKSAPKKLQHFENLFSTPSVIFPNGLLLVIFESSSDAEGNISVRIKCPDYGISQFSQKYKPPIAFIYNDANLGTYEPMIYVEGTGKMDKKGKPEFLVLPTINPEDNKFPLIDKAAQSALKDFITQYLSFSEGCGRFTSPAHPWMPDLDSRAVPRLSELITHKTSDFEAESVLRDRSNRLVGVIFNHTGSANSIFIPSLEDGSLGLTLKTQYDIEGIPLPPLDLLLNALTNKSGFQKFVGLRIDVLLMKDMKYCALRLKSGAIIPFHPVPTTSVLANPIYEELTKKGAKPIAFLPWQEDARFLKSDEPVKESLDIVPEALVEEAYHYLRVSLAGWLQTKQGSKTRRQLNGLRLAHLPLFELRKRADILIEPLVNSWINVDAHAEAIPALGLLRKDCIVEKSKDRCTSSPMCSWIGSSCHIHAGTSEKVPDVKVYFTSRIVDEILRYSNLSAEILNNKVPRIRQPLGLVRTEDSVITGKSKIRELADELGLDHVPAEPYSVGLTYPESAHDDILLRKERPEYIDIPDSWKKAGLRRLAADPIIENRLKTSLVAYTDEPFKNTEKKINDIKKAKKIKVEAINWSDIDWWCFAAAYDTDLLISRYDNESGLAKVVKWFKANDKPASKQFVFVFVVNSPEILLSVKKPLKLADLPPEIKAYLDIGSAITLERLTSA
jgi:hypothetical protein